MGERFGVYIYILMKNDCAHLNLLKLLSALRDLIPLKTSMSTSTRLKFIMLITLINEPVCPRGSFYVLLVRFHICRHLKVSLKLNVPPAASPPSVCSLVNLEFGYFGVVQWPLKNFSRVFTRLRGDNSTWLLWLRRGD